MLGAEACDGIPRGQVAQLEADEPGRQALVERRPQSHALGRSQAFLQPPREAAGALGDPLPPDPFVQVERLRQRPAVLERVEAARRQQRPRRRRPGRFAVHPRLVGPAVEARDRRLEPAPGAPAGPRRARCRAGRTATCGSRPRRSRSRARPATSASTPKPCTPSTHSSTRSRSAPAPVRRAHDVGDVADRQLHARRGVHPGHGDARGFAASSARSIEPKRSRSRDAVAGSS